MTSYTLPDEIRTLPIGETLERLKLFSDRADKLIAAFTMIVDDVLENEWRKQFHAGPRGGLRLKSQASKGGAK
jgi:hypothetical protein